MTTMIETHDLRRTFKSRGGAVEAVRGVDLAVEAGEIFGFLGPNGAGKTTTLRMLATLLTPTGGDGHGRRRRPRAASPQTVRRRIGYVPQGGSTDPAETGRGELVIQGRLYGMDKAAAAGAGRRGPRRARPRGGRGPARPARTRAACAAGSTSASASSIGRRSCSSTSRRPASTRRRAPGCGTRSAASASAGTTVFLTTHYLEEADALADRLAIIDHGKIVAEGTADELKRQVAGDVITLGVDGDRGARPRDRPRPAVRPRGEQRGRARSASTSTRARPPSRSSCGSSTAPGSRARTRSRSPGRASTTSSCARPAGRCARSRRHERDRPRPPDRTPPTTTRNPTDADRSATPGSSSTARCG